MDLTENILSLLIWLPIAGGAGVLFIGEGSDPEGEWPHEPSFLVVGISRAEAEALGRRFGQLAIVYARKGEPPELVELD